MDSVQDNTALSRFELHAGGVTAFLTYIRAAGVVTLVHEEVPNEASGKGLGTALAKGTLDLLRARAEKVIPRCPFVAVYMRRHSETLDLLADPHYLERQA